MSVKLSKIQVFVNFIDISLLICHNLVNFAQQIDNF